MAPVDDLRLAFDEVPELYDRVRPSYPAELFDRLFELLPVRPDIVEVGPGTGIATAELLARGAQVSAVEIGTRLANFVSARFAGNAALRVVNSSFEQAELPAASFDVVFAATAYHWIDEAAQIELPHRVLRDGGLLAVVNLIHVSSPSDGGYFDRVQPIYEAFGNHRRVPPPTYDDADPEIAERLRESDRFSEPVVHRVGWDQRYSSDDYRSLLLTFSGTRAMPPAERADMVDQLVGVIDREYDGFVTRPLLATLTLAARA